MTLRILLAKIFLFIVCVWITISGTVGYAASFCNGTPKNFFVTPTFQLQDIDLPIDSVSYPVQIGTSYYYSENILFDYCWPYNLREQARITRSVLGKFNGQDVYDIGVPHLGITITVADSQEGGFAGGVNMAGNNITDVVPPDDSWDFVPRLGASIRIGLIAFDRYPVGVNTIPTIKIGELSVISLNSGVNSLGGVSDIILNGFSLEVKTKTCSLLQRNFTVPLQTVYKNMFPSVNSEVPGGSVTLHLQCQPGINVYATMTDATNPANFTSLLSLAGGSTAKGVNLKIYREGDTEALNFGPDSSAKGTVNQWKVAEYHGGADPIINLKANYIRTGDITPGTVQAILTITFSYQ
ncbi:TPA: type 1 fimbrial protein [Salmonella enterica]|nr:type 1 fimbrial protein [Salmonella enterica]